MCGILGVFNYGGNKSLVSEETILRMTDEIAHRGPDDAGVYISPDHRVGFGFRRLAIVDLSSAGHQPMANADGSNWIVFNGEIYNHLDIRKDLEAKGYRYHSKSDTETILYAYQEYGIDFITKLYGMFGIAIWDATKERLLLVRDRIGIKPVYYTVRDGALYFASEIKAILRHPAISAEMNQQGLYDYLTFWTTPAGETLFKDIYKLEAGHYLTIDRNGDIRQEKYWDLNHVTEEFPAHQFNDERFCIDNIQRLLRDSIKLRMMSDVPFGVLLSGGIDSSLNVALMSELMTRPVETFSIGFKDLEKYNELGYARQISRQFNTNHHETFLDEDMLLDFLPEMVWHQDEPNGDPVCVPLYYVSKLARDSGTVVVQVGEGSDEEFSGYTNYLREVKYHKYYYAGLPGFAQKMAYPLFKTFMPDSIMVDYARRAVEKDVPYYGGAKGVTEEVKKSLLSAGFYGGSERSSRVVRKYVKEFERLVNGSSTSDYLRHMMYLEFKNRLVELLLMRVDKMSMAVSVESRVPFLDHRLVEFAFRIPQELKIKDGIPKYILKKASEGIIPNEIIYRKKQGFNAPIEEWMRTGKLAGFMRDKIMSSELLRLDIFRREYIDYMFTQHHARKANYSTQLWGILLAAMWYERFIVRTGR